MSQTDTEYTNRLRRQGVWSIFLKYLEAPCSTTASVGYSWAMKYKKTEPAPDSLLVTLDGAARMLSVSRMTVRRLIQAGKLPARVMGRKVMIVRQEIIRYVESLPGCAVENESQD